MMCPNCDVEFEEDDCCPICGMTVDDLMEEGYIQKICPECGKVIEMDYCIYCGYDSASGDYVELESEKSQDFDSFDEDDAICLNCANWMVDPRGSAYGVVCQRGHGNTDPDDSCNDFIASVHYASYGENGQYQFDETQRMRHNLFDYWKG